MSEEECKGQRRDVQRRVQRTEKRCLMKSTKDREKMSEEEFKGQKSLRESAKDREEMSKEEFKGQRRDVRGRVQRTETKCLKKSVKDREEMPKEKYKRQRNLKKQKGQGQKEQNKRMKKHVEV